MKKVLRNKKKIKLLLRKYCSNKKRSHMHQPLPPVEIAKKAAARRALNFVRDGMTVGLGTGSTAKYFVQLLARKIIMHLIK